MGYCFDSTGRLCCDACDNAGQVRKRTCPYKVEYPTGGALPYCQPAALCPTCYEKHRHLLHKDCKVGAATQTARYRAEYDRVQAGDPMVKAAWGEWHEAVPAGFVGVYFEARDGHVYRLVPTDDYNPTIRRHLSDYPNAQPWENHPGETTKGIN